MAQGALKSDRSSAAQAACRFVDASGKDDKTSPIWSPLKISKAEIDSEVDRLASRPKPNNGRRYSLMVHPDSQWNSLTPGIRVAVEVLLPGEEMVLPLQSSSSIGFCVSGNSEGVIDGLRHEIGQFDVWSVPNMAAQTYRNSGKDPHVRLTFSDAPLLEQLYAHYVEGDDVPAKPTSSAPHVRDAMADFVYRMPSGQGAIKTFHAFVDPEVVEQHSRLWRWDEVRNFLNGMDKNQPDLRAAIIALLWNPSTGRTNGSTNTLTAWMSGGVDPNWTETKWDMARTHRHSITAINYAVSGQWRTVVERQDILWDPGDLIITAPAWGQHSNGRCDREAYTFTVQDTSLHSAMNTSMVQEYMDQPPILLGSHNGFKA
jgi:gentisate 1,2-dioxygenase